ncbi:MAG: hypothetical protein ACK4HF_03840 [Paracoccaceae bacterium]
MRPFAKRHENCESALGYPSVPGAEVIGGTVPAGPVQDMARLFAAVKSPGAIHVTLSTTSKSLSPASAWAAVINTYFQICGYQSLTLPWIAYRQPGIKNDHIHMIVAERSFGGRPVALMRSEQFTDDLQRLLAAGLHMHEPRLFDPRKGVTALIRSMTKKGRMPEMQPLMDAINRAFSGWPETFEQFAHLLRLQPGGFSAERKMNGHGLMSFLFKGPGIRPIYGGGLSVEMQPRFMRARFALFRSLRQLRNTLAENILANAPLGQFLRPQKTGKQDHDDTHIRRRKTAPRTSEQDHDRPEVSHFLVKKHERDRARSQETLGAGRSGRSTGAGRGNSAGSGAETNRPDLQLGTGTRSQRGDDAERNPPPDLFDDTDSPPVGGPRPAPLGERLIRIAAIARGYFKEARLEVLPEAAIAVFFDDRRLVVFNSNDDISQLDVRHPRVDAFCLAIKPAVSIPDPTGSGEEDAPEEIPDQAQNPDPEEDQDGPGW